MATYKRNFSREFFKQGQGLAHFLYSIWLFTRSDLKTIVGPSTAFGVSNAFAVSAYSLQPPVTCLTQLLAVFKVTTMVAFWVWINLLPSVIDNQISSKAISEDAANKPWRTLPSRRMTPKQAGALRIPLYACAFIASWRLGGPAAMHNTCWLGQMVPSSWWLRY